MTPWEHIVSRFEIIYKPEEADNKYTCWGVSLDGKNHYLCVGKTDEQAFNNMLESVIRCPQS